MYVTHIILLPVHSVFILFVFFLNLFDFNVKSLFFLFFVFLILLIFSFVFLRLNSLKLFHFLRLRFSRQERGSPIKIDFFLFSVIFFHCHFFFNVLTEHKSTDQMNFCYNHHSLWGKWGDFFVFLFYMCGGELCVYMCRVGIWMYMYVAMTFSFLITLLFYS